MTAEDLKAVAQAYLRRATDAETRLVEIEALCADSYKPNRAGLVSASAIRAIIDGTGQQDTTTNDGGK